MYKTITEYFIEKSNGLMRQISEVRDEGKGYTMHDSGGVEHEVGIFLYGMVRLLKPRMILETGLYHGISTAYEAQALKDNTVGFIDTIEIDQTHIDTSTQLFTALDLLPQIKIHHMKSLDFAPTCKYELMFLDSEMNLRLHELVKFFPYLIPGGYVFIHDFPPTLCEGNVNTDHPGYINWPVGEFPKEFNNLLKDDELRLIHFPNPRGMIGFYKPKSEDYRWYKI